MQISSIQKIILCHKIARFCLTHMEDEAFCGRFFRGSILPVGEHCEPTGKIEPRKNLPQNPHPPCVCLPSNSHTNTLISGAVTKSGTGTWDLGREDAGTRDSVTPGRGTWGRGDAGTRGRGDAPKYRFPLTYQLEIITRSICTF